MALQEIIARLGFQFDDRQLKAADRSVGGLVNRLHQFAGVIAGSLVVRGITRFIDNTTKQGDEIAKTGRQLGINVNTLYAWQNAAEYAGASAEDLTKGLKTLSKRALDADDGLKEAKDSFDRLGVSATDSGGNLKNNEQLLRDVGIALGKVQNETERTALAQELFGRSGLKLIPLFAQGEKGLDALLAKTKEFGIDLTSFASLSEDARDRMKDWDIATFGLKATLITTFLPAINATIGKGAKFIKWLTDVGAGTDHLKSLILSVGVALATKLTFTSLFSMAKAVLVPLAKFLLLYLVIDDLTTFFKGGDSLIGKGLDKIFGAGTGADVSSKLRAIAKALGDLGDDDGWSKVSQALDDLFGPPGEAIIRRFVSDFNVAWSEIKNGWSDFIDDAKENWPAALWELIGDIVKIFTGINIGPDGYRAAKDYIDGLIRGLKKGVTDATGAAGEVASAIVDKVRNVFGEHSPSKVAEMSGMNWDRGLVKGVLREKDNVARAFTSAIPAPIQHASNVTQQNNIPITVVGARDPVSTGQQIGRQVSRQSRSLLEEAAAALIPVG